MGWYSARLRTVDFRGDRDPLDGVYLPATEVLSDVVQIGNARVLAVYALPQPSSCQVRAIEVISVSFGFGPFAPGGHTYLMGGRRSP